MKEKNKNYTFNDLVGAYPYKKNFKYLLKKLNKDLFDKTDSTTGNTILHFLCHRFDEEMVNYVCKQAKEWNLNLDKTNNDNKTPLTSICIITNAINNNSSTNNSSIQNIMSELISHGADINHEDKVGQDLLLTSILLGNVDIFVFLVENGANINKKYFHAQNIAEIALGSLQLNIDQKEMILECILTKEQNFINKKCNDGDYLIHRVCYNIVHIQNDPLLNHKLGVLDLLLAKTINLNVINDTNETILQIISYSSEPKLIQHLIDHGADVNHKNNEGKTILNHIATRMYNNKNSHNFVEILLKNQKIDVNTQDNSAFTPLMNAVRAGNEKVFNLLLQDPRTDINIKSNDGDNVLHIICKSYFLSKDCLDKLDLSKFDLNVKNNDGNTILDLARIFGNPTIAPRIIEYINNKNNNSNESISYKSNDLTILENKTAEEKKLSGDYDDSSGEGV